MTPVGAPPASFGRRRASASACGAGVPSASSTWRWGTSAAQTASCVERLIRERGCDDFKWIEPRHIVVAQWVRMKCQFGCEHYGNAATCPPSAPTVAECERLFSEYSEIALLHLPCKVSRPEDRHAMTRKINRRLLALERDVFLLGHYKALAIFVDPCNLCEECAPDRRDCKLPQQARPSPEALAVDVFSTARQYGYQIEVLTAADQQMSRFGMLLVE